MGQYCEPWGTGVGCCGPYLDFQAYEDERVPGSFGDPPVSNYSGREPIWLGGSVDDEYRIRIAACVNALSEVPDHLLPKVSGWVGQFLRQSE